MARAPKRGEAATIAAKIRDHMKKKTPVRCDPTFMDFDDHWRQVRHFPDLGLARHSIGPRGRRCSMSAALLPGAKVRVVSGFAAGTEGVFLWFHKEPARPGVAAYLRPSRVVTDGIERKIPKKLLAEDVFRMIVLTECLEVVA